MPHAQLTQFVRRLVADALLSHCVYCGRRFQTAGGYAIWFVEENQVKVFEDGGRLVDVLQLELDPMQGLPARIAA